MLSSGTTCYHLGLHVIIKDAMLSSATTVIICDKMLSSGANVIMVSSGANVIIWCYHVMLSSGMITHPFFYFSWKLHSLVFKYIYSMVAMKKKHQKTVPVSNILLLARSLRQQDIEHLFFHSTKKGKNLDTSLPYKMAIGDIFTESGQRNVVGQSIIARHCRLPSYSLTMDQITIRTPNPKCGLLLCPNL